MKNVNKKLIRNKIVLFFDFLLNQKFQADYEKAISNKVLRVGRHTYGRPVVEIYKGSEATVSIGNFCSISKDVTFITGGIHPTNWVSTYPFRSQWKLQGAYEDGMPTTKGDIVVGSDVWIGTGAVILSGVQIGDGAVVAAGSVVTKDVQPYAVVGGVPSKVLRFRFSPEIIEQLLYIKWWNWSDAQILKMIDLLSSPNIDEFLSACTNHED